MPNRSRTERRRRPRPFSLTAALAVAIPLILAAGAIRAQFALGTGFSYQGQLVEGGSPADGLFDFEFRLFDDPAAGAQQGPTVTADDLAVAGGLFSTMLDFGAQFSGERRWLEISVRAGADAGPYSVLAPRVEMTAVPNAIHAMNAGTLDGRVAGDFLEKDGRAFVIVRTTDDAVTNAANLIAAYDQAAALTPHGQPLSADNRAAVLVPPGRYDLGTGQLLMDTEFVDLIGLSSRLEDQYVFGLGNGPGTGVIRQTADDAGIENLRVRIDGILTGSSFAYVPDSDLPATIIRNCQFDSESFGLYSMRPGIIYSGRYEDCIAGDRGFGGGGGTASGVFLDCVGGWFSFGAGGEASGVFTRCRGGFNAFGGSESPALRGIASGTFTDCHGEFGAFGGTAYEYFGPLGDSGGMATGNFIRCSGWRLAFGGAGYASGIFEDCIGGTESFGGLGGFADGTFTDCIGTDGAFGGIREDDGLMDGSEATGEFVRCVGGDGSFGGHRGRAGGTFVECRAGDDAFGGNGGTADGQFSNCSAGAQSYGGFGGTASGTFAGCVGTEGSFGGFGGDATGSFSNCAGGVVSFGAFGSVSGGTFAHCTGGHLSFSETGAPVPRHLFCAIDEGTGFWIQYPGND